MPRLSAVQGGASEPRLFLGLAASAKIMYPALSTYKQNYVGLIVEFKHASHLFKALFTFV